MIKFGIPRSTMALLLRHPGCMPTSLGRFKRIFRAYSDEFEKELMEYTNDMQNGFYGLTINDLQSLAFLFGKGNSLDHPLSKNSPMQDFLCKIFGAGTHRLKLFGNIF